jgi:hypothetical protein
MIAHIFHNSTEASKKLGGLINGMGCKDLEASFFLNAPCPCPCCGRAMRATPRSNSRGNLADMRRPSKDQRIFYLYVINIFNSPGEARLFIAEMWEYVILQPQL